MFITFFKCCQFSYCRTPRHLMTGLLRSALAIAGQFPALFAASITAYSSAG